MGDEWEELKRRERELFGPHPKRLMSLRDLVANAPKESQREFFDAVLEGPPGFPSLLARGTRPRCASESPRERLRKHWRLPR